MTTALGSRTSGVDGSSEGGRINTNNLPAALVLYGVALIQELQRRGYKGKLMLAPIQVDGVWGLQLTHDGDPPADAPVLWHGHRVHLQKLQAPSG